MAVDVLGDAFLIFPPAILFWTVGMPLARRIRLSGVFAVSIVTTIVGFSHIYFILHGPPLVENLNGILQVHISHSQMISMY
jgi:hypothetical protein